MKSKTLFRLRDTQRCGAVVVVVAATVKGKNATSFLIFSVRFDGFECLLFNTIAITQHTKQFLFRDARWLLCKKRIDMWSRAAEREIQSLINSFSRDFRLMMTEKKSRERPWDRWGIYRYKFDFHALCVNSILSSKVSIKTFTSSQLSRPMRWRWNLGKNIHFRTQSLMEKNVLIKNICPERYEKIIIIYLWKGNSLHIEIIFFFTFK